MTKVQLQYDLIRPIDDTLLEQIARAHGIYGLLRVSIAPTLDKLLVEYDATRMNPLEVETALHRLGLPVALKV